MVHALKEAWRVLVPRGIMIDLRPLSVDSPVDIVYRGKNDLAGFVNMSPSIIHDSAADHAIEEVVNNGIFKETMVEKFQLAYYWKTVRGMLAYIRDKWKEDVIIEEHVIQNAYELLKKHRHNAQVRFIWDMKLGKYLKRG